MFVLTCLAGCVTAYKPIQIDATFLQERSSPVGLATIKLPEPDVYFLGAQGLLDIGINRAAMSKVIDRTKTVDMSRAAAIGENLAN
ncbi:MAG: hypothetical protein JNM52_10420, partial [Betaproteobacteria bacterium]|nr:hypothetical protein [Betaproteobacteria bacterium]